MHIFITKPDIIMLLQISFITHIEICLISCRQQTMPDVRCSISMYVRHTPM